MTRVQQGEPLIVIRRGRPIVRVSATTTDEQPEAAHQRLAQAPWVTPPSKPQDRMGARDLLPGIVDGKTLAESVAEDRG